MSEQQILDLIARARRISTAHVDRVPGTTVYALALEALSEVEAALQVGAHEAFEAARPLGVLAARELDDAEGTTAELGSICFQIRDGLRKLAGLPYHA